MSPVIYVFINKGLQMSVGKVASQAVHVVAMVMAASPDSIRQVWLDAPHKTVLIMEARDQAHLINVKKYLKDRGITGKYIVDEGVNEVDSHVITSYATQVLDRDSDLVFKIMGTFKLYRDTVRLTLEIDK
jgi:peptidyl-tRNA hydrolase